MTEHTPDQMSSESSVQQACVHAADSNSLKVPSDESAAPDEQVWLMSDLLPTAWHQACDLGEAGKGDTVATWGSGQVWCTGPNAGILRSTYVCLPNVWHTYELLWCWITSVQHTG